VARVRQSSDERDARALLVGCEVWAEGSCSVRVDGIEESSSRGCCARAPMQVPLRPAGVVQVAVDFARQAAGQRTGEGGPVLERQSAPSHARRTMGVRSACAREGTFDAQTVGYAILRHMTNALKEALTELERLPAADQENIGRQMLQHVEKLRLLREDIDASVRSLDAGMGREVDMRDVVSRAHARHEKGQ
jgi:hypothetical protein